MRVYWVRHAAAVRRGEWRRTERLRPLTGGGHRQAQRLLELFEGAPLAHLLTSPDLRCRQTLEPLAAQRGLPIQPDARLAAGRSAAGALALLGELGGDSRRALLARRRDPARDRTPLRRGPAPRARADLRKGIRLDRGCRARPPRAGPLRAAAREGPRARRGRVRRGGSAGTREAARRRARSRQHLLPSAGRRRDADR